MGIDIRMEIRSAGHPLIQAFLLGWQNEIGARRPSYFADIVAVPGNPLEDISALNPPLLRDEKAAPSTASPEISCQPLGTELTALSARII